MSTLSEQLTSGLDRLEGELEESRVLINQNKEDFENVKKELAIVKEALEGQPDVETALERINALADRVDVVNKEMSDYRTGVENKGTTQQDPGEPEPTPADPIEFDRTV